MLKVSAGSVTLETVDRGEGPTLLLVHGFPLDHSMWDAQIDEFAKRYRVIAPDLRGLGRSQVVAGTATMRQMADDLAALLDSLRVTEPVICCGLSMGGYIAMEFWQLHAARLKALILCDTRAAADSDEGRAARYVLVEHVLRGDLKFAADAMLPKLFAPATVEKHPEMVQTWQQKIVNASPEGVAAAARGLAERSDMREALRRVAVPTLVVVGEHDALAPPGEMRQIADSIPGAKFVEIAGAGHMSPLEQPTAFNAAVASFLDAIK